MAANPFKYQGRAKTVDENAKGEWYIIFHQLSRTHSQCLQYCGYQYRIMRTKVWSAIGNFIHYVKETLYHYVKETFLLLFVIRIIAKRYFMLQCDMQPQGRTLRNKAPG